MLHILALLQPMAVHSPPPEQPPSTTTTMDSALSSNSFATEDDPYDYLTDPNENLVCPICRNPFIEPVMCESSDHVFCRICLIKSLEVSPTCPIDRLPLSLSLVIPAPKIINKLVDELLVSCPFKSKLSCPFVCQRDLIAAHLRSHQHQAQIADHHHPDIETSAAPLDQNIQAPNQTSHQSNTPDHNSISTSSPQLRFQWLSGRATLVTNPSNDASSFTTLMTSAPTSSAKSKPEMSHCQFERFGCSFVGTPEMINQHHISDSSVSSDGESLCPFVSVREILYWFEHLEARNIELKEQLSQSLVQRSQLTSVLESLKASFRQLWLSHQSGGYNVPLINAPTHQSRPFALDQLTTTTFSGTEYPESHPTTTLQPNPDPSSPTRRSSDSFLHATSSRMNYDSLNGHRLKHFDHYPPPSNCPIQFYHPLGSPSSLSKINIRVSTFLRRGEIVTPTTDIPDDPLALPESSSGPQEHFTSILQVPPRQNTLPLEDPARSSPPSVLSTQPTADPHIRDSLDTNQNQYDPHKQASIRQASRLPYSSNETTTISQTSSRPSSEPTSTNEQQQHVGVSLSRKIGELIGSIQSSLKAWHPPPGGPIILPNDLGVTDRSTRVQGVLAPDSFAKTVSESTAMITPVMKQEEDHHHLNLLSNLEKIEYLMGTLFEYSSASSPTTATTTTAKSSVEISSQPVAAKLTLKSPPSDFSTSPSDPVSSTIVNSQSPSSSSTSASFPSPPPSNSDHSPHHFPISPAPSGSSNANFITTTSSSSFPSSSFRPMKL
ncbi:hypothetical protein Pst134EA_000641 [Puccinia striiformis f. sp. tritici]|uniref:hypothetical protein n=1 Tax=Puccinia striiformis f. sp. tritici TaxID=168172 RepID=UPI00200888C8|nr:hypothetical protein Pst134EA_000641 [Puccinia striiformis f. sp. tritici]KAH9473560.1 hypothetical protein Pst134EA_000641 [Puccinia striiformis f. sp. tritici]